MSKHEQKPPTRTPSRISMHEGLPDWDDCCTCAAEPYWLEAGAAMAREAEAKASAADTERQREQPEPSDEPHKPQST